MASDKRIVMFYPYVSERAIQQVEETLRSRWIGQGPKVNEFEAKLQATLDIPYAVAVNGVASAVRLALAVAGVGPGDEVITTPQACTAVNHPILEQYATPVFADIQYLTANIDPADIEHRITERTKAIICVHWGGYPCDMDEINAIARKYDLIVIEDASQAQGALYKGRKTGSLGHIGTMSTMWGKNLPSCGEGGILTTDNTDFRDEACMVRLFGERIEKDEKRAYDAASLGWNYRANVMNVAFVHSQLNRLDEFNRLFPVFGFSVFAIISCFKEIYYS